MSENEQSEPQKWEAVPSVPEQPAKEQMTVGKLHGLPKDDLLHDVPVRELQPGETIGNVETKLPEVVFSQPQPMAEPQRTRHVTAHQVDECNRALTVIGYVMDGPEAWCYRVFGIDGGEADDPQDHGYPLTFQRGAVHEFGRNGLTNEVLLAVIIDRLEGFQEGPHACLENSQAIAHLRYALGLMRKRSERREAVGVEGTSQQG
jgi:hypothetical protein